MKRLAGIEGCTDHGCIFGHPGGMGTNGGCACEKEVRSVTVRRRLRKNIQAYQQGIEVLQQQVAALQAQVLELQNELRRTR